MSTEQEQLPSSSKKKDNWFLNRDGTLKMRSWIALIILAIISIVGLIQLGYRVGWTGFQGKTFWDWMQLFLVSTVLGAGAYWFNFQQTAHQKTLAEDEEQAKILEAYLDRMKEFLLQHDLRGSAVNSDVRQVARTWTLTTLRRLKGEHISMLFTFLQDAMLNRANIESAIIGFQDANLRRIDLHEVELREVDWSLADLRGANLSFADLHGAKLSLAKLHGADLSFAKLHGANLHGADLRGAQGITTEELVSQANSLEDATLPDGTLYQKASVLDLVEEGLPKGATIGSDEKSLKVPATDQAEDKSSTL